VETSTYSSEIIALKITIEMVEVFRYKLKMFGVGLKGPARVFCDNMAVVLNSSFPESTLTKKNGAVAYGKNKVKYCFKKLRRAKLIKCTMN